MANTPTPHNEAKLGEIAKTVLMPGDPLRAKYIAENFLENPKLVNKVRNMFCYTGTYEGKEVSVMGSGMGRSSASVPPAVTRTGCSCSISSSVRLPAPTPITPDFYTCPGHLLSAATTG